MRRHLKPPGNETRANTNIAGGVGLRLDPVLAPISHSDESKSAGSSHCSCKTTTRRHAHRSEDYRVSKLERLRQPRLYRHVQSQAVVRDSLRGKSEVDHTGSLLRWRCGPTSRARH